MGLTLERKTLIMVPEGEKIKKVNISKDSKSVEIVTISTDSNEKCNFNYSREYVGPDGINFPD